MKRVEVAVVALPASPSLKDVLPDAKATRVVAGVLFPATNGEPFSDFAYVDTGAPMSVVPQRIWQNCSVEITAEHEVKGLALPTTRGIPAYVGRIGFSLLDNGRAVVHLRPLVYLARSNSVPLLLGIHEVLARFRLEVDFPRRTACLLEPNPASG